MYSTVVNLNPNVSLVGGYYAWDALDAACALTARAGTDVKGGPAGGPAGAGTHAGTAAGAGGTLCRLEHGIETQVVLSGPGRGSIRVLEPARSGLDPTRSGSRARGADAAASVAGLVGGTPLSSQPAAEVLSAVKRVSAVVGVEASEFYAFMLATFSRS